MTGICSGGAGGIEAVFTALALRDQFAPPTIHYEQPDPECDLDYVPNVGREMKMEYALSNSLASADTTPAWPSRSGRLSDGRTPHRA